MLLSLSGKRTKLIKTFHKNEMFFSFSNTGSKRLMADTVNYHCYEINTLPTPAY